MAYIMKIEASDTFPVFYFEDYELDLDRCLLLRDGAEVQLRLQSFEVLRYLVERSGQLVTKEELLSEVWAGRAVTDDSITQCLMEIRAALGDESHSKVKTLPRRGYLFDLPVSDTEPGFKSATVRRFFISGRKPGIALVAAGIALVLILSFLAWRPGLTLSPANQAIVIDTETEPATDNAKSIAVLPFVDMSPDQDQGYFADGLTEELINRLTQIDELLVTGRTSSFQFKGKSEGHGKIGKILGVNHLLEGSVRKYQGQLRITAQLIELKGGFHLWSKTYDRQLDDFFAIQEEIAQSVAVAVGIKMRVDKNTWGFGTFSIEAFEHAMLATTDYLGSDTESKLQRFEHLRQATEIDPEYAFAWAWMAHMYVFEKQLLSPDWRRISGELLEKATRLDPDSVPAFEIALYRYVALAQWADAERALRKMTKYRSSLVGVGQLNLLVTTGQAQAAVTLAQRKLRRDPLAEILNTYLQHAFAMTGRPNEALEQSDILWEYRHAAEIAQEALFTTFSHIDGDAYKKWLSRVLELPAHSMVHQAMSDRISDHMAALHWLRSANLDSHADVYAAQAWAAHLGDPELALEFMQSSPDPWAFWAPYNGEVRRLFGFKELVGEMGMVDYWREFGWNDFCQPVGKDDFECG